MGLQAQHAAVEKYLDGGHHSVEEFTETESGKNNERPKLKEALARCRAWDATLIVAKLDRLSRNARFLLTVVEESAPGRGVIFCDIPGIPEGPEGKMIITQMAAVAEWEAQRISRRIKEALAARKKSGTPLGKSGRVLSLMGRKGAKKSAHTRGAEADQRDGEMFPEIDTLRRHGYTTLRQIAAQLNAGGKKTPRGGRWSAVQVARVLRRGEPVWKAKHARPSKV